MELKMYEEPNYNPPEVRRAAPNASASRQQIAKMEQDAAAGYAWREQKKRETSSDYQRSPEYLAAESQAWLAFILRVCFGRLGRYSGLPTWSEIWCDVENSKSFRSSRDRRIFPGHRLKGASALHNYLASIFTAPSVTAWSDMSGNTRKTQVTQTCDTASPVDNVRSPGPGGRKCFH